MKKLIALITLTFFVMSLSGQVSTKIEQQIRTLSDKFTAASLEGNLSEMIYFYAYDAISMPNYEKMIEGRTDIINKEKEMRAAGYEITGLKTEPYKFYGNHKNVLEIGTYEITMMAPSIGQAFKDTGSYMTFWSKKGSEWLITAEIWNTDENPLERYREAIESGADQSKKPARKPSSTSISIEKPGMGEKKKGESQQEVKTFDPTTTTIRKQGEEKEKENVSADPKQDSESNNKDTNNKIKIKKK
jgi:ketosteroid isomerase-like protein